MTAVTAIIAQPIIINENDVENKLLDRSRQATHAAGVARRSGYRSLPGDIQPHFQMGASCDMPVVCNPGTSGI